MTPRLSPWTLACLRALVTAAMFLAGTLGPSWFPVFEVPQNADYVLTMRGTAPPGPAVFGPIAGATSGTPSKHSRWWATTTATHQQHRGSRRPNAGVIPKQI